MTTNSRHALVVGASRGIGLELVRALSARGHRVSATYRAAPGELVGVPGAALLGGLDVTQPAGWEALAATTGPLTDVFVNAGIYPAERGLDLAVLERNLAANTVGALRAVEAALPALGAGGKVILITSRMGSIGDNTSGGSLGYRVSKAALNMAGRTLALDLHARGIAVALVHPGFVKTAMTHHTGHIGPAEAAAGIVARWDELTLETSGTFWHQNGERLPW